jgi:hypothetical protein
MAALLQPLANCADILVKDTVGQYLNPCMEKAFVLVFFVFVLKRFSQKS